MKRHTSGLRIDIDRVIGGYRIGVDVRNASGEYAYSLWPNTAQTRRSLAKYLRSCAERLESWPQK